MTMSYKIAAETRKQYAGLYLLMVLKEDAETFAKNLTPAQKVLEPIFSWLQTQAYVQFDAESCYRLSTKGREVLERFLVRYAAFVEEFDIYCAVDLKEGDFAFRYYGEHDETSWQDFLASEQWDDLRVAVAEYRNWDPIEVIFMGMVDEGSFGVDHDGHWSYDHLLGAIWDHIEEVAATAIRLKSLAYEDEGRLVSGEDVIKDVISQGQQILQNLRPPAQHA